MKQKTAGLNSEKCQIGTIHMTHYCHIHMSATCPCGIFMAFEYRNPRFNTWFPIFDSSSEQETATFLADYQKIGEIETDIEYEKKYSGYYTPLPH